jgi:hypothetical protein
MNNNHNVYKKNVKLTFLSAVLIWEDEDVKIMKNKI